MKLSMTSNGVTVTVETTEDDLTLIDNEDNWPNVEDLLKRMLVTSGYSKQGVDEMFGRSTAEERNEP